MALDPRQFILDQRAKRIPDEKIYDDLQKELIRQQPVDRGFVGEILPTAGAIGGGILGAPLGPPGVIGGSAVGGALGETAQQTIEKTTGERENFDVGQIGATGVISGAIPVATKAISAVTKPVLKPVATKATELIKPKLLDLLKWASGYDRNVLDKAMQRTPGVIEGIKKGEPALVDAIKKSALKISELGKRTLTENAKALDILSKEISLGGPGKKASQQIILEEGRKFIPQIQALLRKNNIGITEKGSLNFIRGARPSRIVPGSDQKVIQDAYNLIKTIQKDSSIKHIDAVFERLLVLKSKTPTGTPTGPQTKAILGEIQDELLSFVKSVYPKYHTFLQDNIPKRILINEAKEIFGHTSHPSPTEVSQITGRLLQLYNTGRLELREGIEKVGEKVGEDVTGVVSGTILKLDDAFSFRARELGTRGMLEKFLETVPRKLLDNYISTGKISGDLLNHPAIQTLGKITNISAKTLIQQIANISAQKTSK